MNSFFSSLLLVAIAAAAVCKGNSLLARASGAAALAHLCYVPNYYKWSKEQLQTY